MKSDQQKSFYENGHARYHYHQQYANHGVSHNRHQQGLPGESVLWLLRQLWLNLNRLLVVAKFQFFKNTAVAPSAIRVPVLKVGVLAGLSFFVLRDDLSISVGKGKEKAHFGGGMAEGVSLKEPAQGWTSRLASLFEKKDYFADDPSDDAEARRVKEYIRRFKDLAIQEKEKYGIPASIKMAQGIVESNAGASALSQKNNNHFGIKCFSRTCKKGHCTNFGDDSHKDFFRKYGSSWDSWRAHSELIVQNKYKSLLKYGDDYRKWAHGLKKMGYATAKHYDQTLIDMIEKYHLDELDK
ncbi:MAG: glucosaminidase domain-containing protein [Saprospiraceae bacterium]